MVIRCTRSLRTLASSWSAGRSRRPSAVRSTCGEKSTAPPGAGSEPFLALGASGEVILETVERYLANESRLDVTASDLSVHPNTVRYRLTRFEEVGGGSLRSHEISAEVWWVLQRRHVDRASKARGGRRT